MTEIRDFLREQLARPHVGWSIGIFGALAEFHREESEEAECRELTVSTPLGAIRLEPVEGCRPVRYEPRSAKHAGRHFGVALCLPEAQARMQCRCALTELGEDREAINAKDRRALLFDPGLPAHRAQGRRDAPGAAHAPAAEVGEAAPYAQRKRDSSRGARSLRDFLSGSPRPRLAPVAR
jgi:hypothetical protein